MKDMTLGRWLEQMGGGAAAAGAADEKTLEDTLALLGVMPIAGGSYFLNDLENSFTGGVSIQPALRTATATGQGVDLSSGDGQAFAVVIGGTYTDGTHAVTLQESKNDGTADEHTAADAYAAIADTVSITNVTGTSLQIVTFRPSKPWVRAVLTVTGSPATGAIVGVLIIAPLRQQ